MGDAPVSRRCSRFLLLLQGPLVVRVMPRKKIFQVAHSQLLLQYQEKSSSPTCSFRSRMMSCNTSAEKLWFDTGAVLHLGLVIAVVKCSMQRVMRAVDIPCPNVTQGCYCSVTWCPGSNYLPDTCTPQAQLVPGNQRFISGCKDGCSSKTFQACHFAGTFQRRIFSFVLQMNLDVEGQTSPWLACSCVRKAFCALLLMISPIALPRQLFRAASIKPTERCPQQPKV